MPFFDRVVGSSGIYLEPRNRPVMLIERLSGQDRTRFNPLSVEGFAGVNKRELLSIRARGFPRINKVKSLSQRLPFITRALTVIQIPFVGVRVKLFGERIPRVYDRGRY